jgi:hypothetical protein
MNDENGWRVRTLLIGALVGALTGLAGAFLLVRRAEERGTQPKVDAGEGIRISLLVMGLLRQVALLGEGQESDD